VAPLALGLLLFGCSSGTPVTVINHSDMLLEDVVVSGSGFSERLGQIGPHAELRRQVEPRGESGVQVRFNADGKTISFGPAGYFEGGGKYVVTVTVSPSLTVSVRSEISSY
jgi:hypothetical protein